LHGGYSQGKKNVVSDDKKEKGLLWGTKLTFFRRKEIRVSLLLLLMQVLCHFLKYCNFIWKPLLVAEIFSSAFYYKKSAEYNFLYFG